MVSNSLISIANCNVFYNSWTITDFKFPVVLMPETQLPIAHFNCQRLQPAEKKLNSLALAKLILLLNQRYPKYLTLARPPKNFTLQANISLSLIFLLST